MFRSKLAVLSLALALPAWAELTASSPRWNGAVVRFVTGLQPASSGTVPLSGAIIVHDTVISRMMQDAPNKIYFGYDIDLEPLTDPNVYSVHIQQLTLPPEKIGPGWKKMDLPKYPVIPNVRTGQTVAIDLLVNPRNGQKMVDYLTLIPQTPPPAEPARDFSVADAEFLIDRPKVRVNGTLVESSNNYKGGIAGVATMFYLEGHGRFILSLRPLPELGFHKGGEVFGSTLIVRDNGVEYRLDCARPIAPGSGRFNLYLIHDPSWKPKWGSSSEDIFLWAADNPAWLIHQ